MSFKHTVMKTLFVNKKVKMIPEHLQPLTDRIGLSLTGIAAFLNVKIGFLGAHFKGIIFSPVFNSLLTIVISLLSILWILMKIYDQYLTTKLKKEAMAGSAPEKPKRSFFNRKKEVKNGKN